MLHPHVPEDMKHFGKHLFATFLGLLMAVGLESCHQEHTRKQAAQEGYEALLDEVRINQKETTSLILASDKALANNVKAIALLEDAANIRRMGRPYRLPPIEESLVNNPSGTFKTSAWSIAVSAQYIPRFPRAQAERLSDHYDLIRRFQTFQDQMDFIPGLVRILPCRTADEMQTTLNQMKITELEQALVSLRMVHEHCRTLKRVAIILQKSGAEILQETQSH